MSEDPNDIAPQPDVSQDVVVTSADWNELIVEWQQAGVAANEALAKLTWPAIDIHAFDAWLSAVERQTVAKTRLAALGELQLRKK